MKITCWMIALFLCMAHVSAQEWSKPQVPGASLSSLKSTEVVYFYNVDADVFVINGMDWNTNACTTRLNSGDTKISTPHQCYALVNNANVSVRLLAFGNSYISCASNNAYDIYVDQSKGYTFKFTETETGSKVYTLRNTTYSKDLDLAWPTGGHLTLINGAGATHWAFIPQTAITNGSYARYKAQKQLYAVYEVIMNGANADTYEEALNTAKAVYENSSATTTQLQTAAQNLFKAAAADIEGPLDVSFMLKNADMASSGNCTNWTTTTTTFDWGEYEIFHASLTLTQKPTLPQGIYDVAFHSLYRQDGTQAAPTLSATAQNTVKVNIPRMDDLNFLVGNTNSNNWSSGDEFPRPNGMQSAAQALTHPNAAAIAENVIVDETGKLTITARMSSTTQWLNWQKMRIIYKGNGTSSLKLELDAIIQAARTLYGDGSGKGAANLLVVIEKAETLKNSTTATAQELIDMKAELEEAMDTYRLESVSLDNPLDWSERIENRSFEKAFTGWVNNGMQTQTNSAFSLKVGNNYVEKWVSAGNSVGDCSLTQTIQNLEMGVYILKATAHNIQEGNASTQHNAWLIANTNRVEINKDNTYELVFTNIENNAVIGFEAVGATGNWLAVDYFQLYYAGGEFADFKAALEQYLASAIPYLNEKLQNPVRDELQTAINKAQEELTKPTADGYPAVSTPIRNAIEKAKASIQAYAELKAAIDQAEINYGDGALNGAEEFLSVITTAKGVYENLDSTQEEMKAQIKLLEQASLKYKLDNASGLTPKVTTDTRYIRGAIAAFGRMTVSGVSSSNILEQGFCYSTHTEPTVLDQRSTDYLEQNGKIYVMPMEPATIYYMRAYAMTKNYQVGYGNVIKLSTLPMGNVTWSYNNNGDDSHTARVENALAEACYYWSNYTNINGFHVTGNYSPGTPTADCGYGGWMRIGTNTGQRTGTCMHEMNHGIGGGTIEIWGGWNESPLRTSINGDWTGERANAALRFWENRSDLVITAAYDGAHWGFRPLNGVYEDGGGSTAIWENKYAFNGAHLEPYAWAGPQDWNGTQLVFIGNAIINQGMCEDGLVPVNYYSGGFCNPAYVFAHEEEEKYYVKCENTELGLYDSYLTENANGTLSWKEIDHTDITSMDEAAWYVSFNPKTQYYQFRNAKSGHYISYSSNTFKGMSKANANGTTEQFHLIRGRNDVNVGGIKVRGYWLIHPTNSNLPPTLTAKEGGSISALSLNLYDSGSDQRWVFLKADELNNFDQGAKKALQTDLRNFIAQIRKLERVPHTEDVTGADGTLENTLTDIETISATVSTSAEMKPLIGQAREAAMTFLSEVTPTSVDTPFDLTFMMDNAAIDDNSGWSDTPTFNNSCCEYFERTFDFNQTLKNMPKGTYRLTAQAFQRPGAYASAYANYIAGKNDVTATLYINTKTQKLCHIAEGASTTSLHENDAKVGSPEVYIPDNMASAAAHFKKGYYENEVVTTMSTGNNLKIGIKGTVSNTGYWTIFDNFHLYYYGSMSSNTVTGIKDLDITTAVVNSKMIYNLQGQLLGTSLDELPSGIYIIDGKKVMKR